MWKLLKGCLMKYMWCYGWATKEPKAYAQENGLLFMEAPAKTAINVSAIFNEIGESSSILIWWVGGPWAVVTFLGSFFGQDSVVLQGSRPRTRQRVPWSQALTYEELWQFLDRSFINGDGWLRLGRSSVGASSTTSNGTGCSCKVFTLC
ncbi:unnamed protein product [Urochloa humidicola]